MTGNKDKVAIVTGAAKNIGRATCDSLSKLGFNILVHANSDKEGAMETHEIVKKNGVNADIFIGDLTKEDTSRHLVDAGSKLGDISILVNNASQREFNKFDDMSFDEWRFVLSINLDTLFHTCKAVIPEMKKNNWGRIINMASVSVKEPLSYLALSNTIRSAVTSWGKTLSIESGKHNITVNNILTGFFNTERLNQLNSEKSKKFNVSIEEVFDKMSEMVPLKRIGKTEEFGYLVAFLSSEYADYINGTNIPIDGGLLKSM